MHTLYIYLSASWTHRSIGMKATALFCFCSPTTGVTERKTAPEHGYLKIYFWNILQHLANSVKKIPMAGIKVNGDLSCTASCIPSRPPAAQLGSPLAGKGGTPSPATATLLLAYASVSLLRARNDSEGVTRTDW